jgi:methionyl-tRNA formyltransferase
MKIVFFGNTKYSVIGQEIIHKKFPISLVVTIPDRPFGRKHELKPSPVKQFAQKHNIPILETAKLDEKTVREIRNIGDLEGPPDFLIVEDYGLILPESLLEIPRYAALNVHHSLLPKYQGPSPAPSAILNGEKVSGVTIISMTELVDAGDILAQQKYEPTPNETTDSLLEKLNKLGGELVLKVIADFINGKENPIKQDDKQASYTKRLTKQDGYINLKNPPDPVTFDRMTRAFYPWPTVWTKIDGKIFKFLPSTILPSHSTFPFLIQPEGKRALTISEFKNGYPKLYEKIKPLLST